MPRSRPAFAAPAETPMSELNTTPLIDVMLVLLIMFIITIPITTHEVPMDLPQGMAERADPIVYRLNLDAAGRITIDGAPVPETQLRARLDAIVAQPTSQLELRAEAETPYDSFDRVLATVKRAGVVRLGMVGNERFVGAVDR